MTALTTDITPDTLPTGTGTQFRVPPVRAVIGRVAVLRSAVLSA